MQYWGDPSFVQMGLAVLVAVLVGFASSWSMERLFLKEFMDDRVSGIALSCALAFVLMMGASTYLLTKASPVPNGPIVIPPFGYALSFVMGLALVGVLRVRSYSKQFERDDEVPLEPDDDDLSRFEDEVRAADSKYRHRNYLLRHWVGNLPLPLAYWVNGALLSTLVVAAAELLTRRIEEGGGSLRQLALASLVYIAMAVSLWVWSSVGIWRSAYWHRRRGGSARWGVAARLLVFVGLLATMERSQDLAQQAVEYGRLAMGSDAIGEVAEMKVTAEGDELLVRGNLSQGAAERFRAVLGAAPAVKTVILTSRGGRMLEAERMAAIVRARELDTRVDDFCMSACTSVLLAGRNRSAPNLARIGFHQPSFPGLRGSGLRDAVERMRSDYVEAGVDPTFVWKAVAVPADDMWFPTNQELVEANVLTGSEITIVASRSMPDRQGDRRQRAENLTLQRLRSDMQAEAARVNASAPTKLDPYTTLNSASAEALTLTYRYTLRTGGLDLAAVRASVTGGLRQDTCANAGLAAAVGDGGRFVFSYRDEGGRRLFDVTIDDC